MHHLLVVRLCFRDTKKKIRRGYAQQYSFKRSDALDDKQVTTDKQNKSAAYLKTRRHKQQDRVFTTHTRHHRDAAERTAVP